MTELSYYQKNRDVQINKQRVRDQKCAEKFNEKWRAKQCSICNCDAKTYKKPIVWHHRSPSDKEFNITWKECKNMSDLDIMCEILKCTALCISCHRKEHAKMRRDART